MKWSPRNLAVPLAAFGAVFAVVGVALAQSPSPSDLMEEANTLYERGEFAGAAQQYEALLDQGYADADIYYNLGNAHYKNGDLGRAVLNFLRAEELSPRDSDIKANLDFTRGKTVDRVEPGGGSFVAGVSGFARGWATTGEVGATALLLWLVSAAAMGLLIVWRGIPRRNVLRNGAVAASVVTFAMFIVLLTMLYANPNDDSGVIVETTVDVMSGPGDQYETEFTLNSGAQVRLVDTRQGWVRIALPGDDLQGWAPSNAVEAIRPGG